MTLSPRQARLADFLAACGWSAAERSMLAGDASNRRYDRLVHGDLGRAVLMDAPPASGEDVAPFAALAGMLAERGLSAPRVLAADLDGGFLLLEDLGDDLYAPLCARHPALEPALYAQAVDLLADLAATPLAAEAEGAGARYAIPPYDGAALWREAALAAEWWLPGVTGAAPSADLLAEYRAEIDAACAEAAADRSTLALRDYHAENLIWLPDRAGAARVGLLDFQDALIGHPAYDLVSLLEDARRDVREELAEAMIERFLAAAPARDSAEFRAAYAALGAQRNLKIVGIFARLWLRDGKDRYLAHIPRVWRYLQRDLSHPALASLRNWVARRLPEPTPERLAALRARAPMSAPPDSATLDTAMILAAGLGTRMRPLTDTTPKPLLRAGGETLLDHAIGRAAETGARRCVVNIHHFGEQVIDHLARRARPEILISDERAALLETGGGVLKALARIDRDAFLCVNSDNVWLGARALAPLLEAWRDDAMDALLLLSPIERAIGYARAGDFFLDAEDRLAWRGAAERAPLVYTGAQILTRRAFAAAPDGAFSLTRIWDRAIEQGRAFGCLHQGGWVDVGTPDGLVAAAKALGEMT